MTVSDSRKSRAHMMRAMWIAINGPCQRCGSWQNSTIDHIDPKTKDPSLRKSGGGTGGTAKIWYWSDIRRTRELAKCQVLCQWCHQEKSRLEQTYDRLELDRREAELRRKHTLLRYSESERRRQELLSRHIELEPELESAIDSLRAKYGGFEEEDEEELPIYTEEPPEGWPTGLIVWPF